MGGETESVLKPLPAEKLCNKWGDGNPINGDGPLGNQNKEKMHYIGGDRKELVKTVQRMLKTLGYDLGTSGPDGNGIDGHFGDITEEHVTDFQGKNKDWDGEVLKEEGLIGPRTSDALNRAMVGEQYEGYNWWYDYYETPKELTINFLQITATTESLKKEKILKSRDVTSAKIILVDLDEYIITLLDSSGNRFSFEDEGKFRVLYKKEKLLAEGKITSKDDIEFKSAKEPYLVELSVDKDISTFLIEDSIGYAAKKGKNEKPKRRVANPIQQLIVKVMTNYINKEVNGADVCIYNNNTLVNPIFKGKTGANGEVRFNIPADGKYQMDIVPEHINLNGAGPNMDDVDMPNPPKIIYNSNLVIDLTINGSRVTSAQWFDGNGKVSLRTSTLVVEAHLQPIWIEAMCKNSPLEENGTIDLIVLHHTGGNNDSSLKELINSNDKSAHYFIDTEGQIVKLVKDSERACHAGCSYWGGKTSVNNFSIGIEIAHKENENYTEEQYTALIGSDGSTPGLLQQLKKAHRLPRNRIVGHSDIGTHETITNIQGKRIIECKIWTKWHVLGKKEKDPGKEFEWERLENLHLGLIIHKTTLFHSESSYGGFFKSFKNKELKFDDNDKSKRYGGKRRKDFPTNLKSHPVKELQDDLKAIGYSVDPTGIYDTKTKHAVWMFQMHFYCGINQRKRLNMKVFGNLDESTATMIKQVIPVM